jgi:transposase-like protein
MIFTPSIAGALIRLVCPHCGEIQARARKPEGRRYACRKCRKRFRREQGEDGARKRR